MQAYHPIRKQRHLPDFLGPMEPSPLIAIQVVHRAVGELVARHLGRFPVLALRMQRDADSSRDFAARMVGSPRKKGQPEAELALATRVFLDALLFDCREFARQRGIGQWSASDARLPDLCALVHDEPGSLEAFRELLAHPESAVNAVIGLIRQAAFLLDRRPGLARPLSPLSVTADGPRTLKGS